MKMKNTSKESVRIDELGLVIDAGATEEIPDGYARQGRRANGGRKASVIEMLAPSLEPADENEKNEWMQPAAEFNTVPQQKSLATPQEFMAQGHKPQVAHLMAQRQNAMQQAELTERREQQAKSEREGILQGASRLAAQEEQAKKKAEEEDKKQEEQLKKLAQDGQKQLKEEEQFNARIAAAQRQQRETGTTSPQEDRERLQREQEGHGGEDHNAPQRGKKH
jgi:hypothetical protein